MTKTHWFLCVTMTLTFALLAAGESCPRQYPFAYHNGQYCCAHDKEKDCDGIEGCSGVTISQSSRCCEDDEFIPCESEACENHVSQCSHPFKKKAKVKVPCKFFNQITMEKDTRYTITSPGFPGNYPESFQVCGFLLEVPKKDTGVVMECPKFSVGNPNDKNCTGDSVHIDSGRERLCGKQDGLKKSLKPEAGNVFTIVFENTGGSQHPGFSCDLYIVDDKNDGKEEPCFSPHDPHSFSRPDEAKVTHMHLDLFVDFSTKTLNGSVTLTVEKVKPSVTHLVLDAWYLDIQNVTDEKTNKLLDFRYGTESYVGAKLEITLPTLDQAPKVKVFYTTSQKSPALQWLNAPQTGGKVLQYLFSMAKFISARSILPCQDTPSTQSKYSAEITAPVEVSVIMSALNTGAPSPGTDNYTRVHRFIQEIPIPSYLIALVAGDIESRSIGPRSIVWSEREIVDKAAKEFEDTESMLQKAEELCGHYIWSNYDILVLPPSFAYGGLENPTITYATPTLLAGDKSLADIIAHEIAHSWSGNLVTNKNFEHYWIVEGFTMFIQRKILGSLLGKPARDFDAIGGWKILKQEIDRLKEDNPLTALVTDLEGVDPVDAFSAVPYEKGHTFLWYLEDLVGGPNVFDPFLRAYFEAFKFKAIDSYEFKDFFVNQFKDLKAIEKVDWEGWFKNPGMPPYKPNFDTSLAVVCQKLSARWVNYDKTGNQGDFKMEDIKGFSSQQKVELLALLLEEKPLKIPTLEKMQQAYNLNSVENSEIRFRWIRLGLLGRWKDAISRATSFLTEQGRMKFIRPIYRDLFEWEEEGRPVALEVFERSKDSLMDCAVRGVKQDLKLEYFD